MCVQIHTKSDPFLKHYSVTMGREIGSPFDFKYRIKTRVGVSFLHLHFFVDLLLCFSPRLEARYML